MKEIRLEEYVNCINMWLIDIGASSLCLQEKKFIIEDLQKIVDEYASCMELSQLRILIAIEASRIGYMIKLGVLPADEMEIEIEKLSKNVVEAKRKYLQIV